jgi:hypothetical protein
MWNYEGMNVQGLYMGCYPVSGKVRMSRVKYGGGVTHHLDLDEEIEIFGNVRHSVLLDHADVTQVKDAA